MRFMADIQAPARIVDMGCGTGLLTQLVADRFPDADLLGVDIAGNLLEIARRRFTGNNRVSFEVANAMTFKPRRPVQLVVSASTFHWITPMEDLFSNIAGMLEPDGNLVFSIMLRGTLIELHESRRRVAHDKQALSVLPNAQQALAALDTANLVVIDKHEEVTQVDFPSATDLLYSLHNVGVTGGSLSSSGRPLTRLELAQWLADYDACYSTPEGGVFATYRVLYVSAIPRRKA